MKLGLQNLIADEYHKSIGISFSGLKEFAKSPAHYDVYRRKPYEQSNDIGTLFHLAVLEPDRFTSLVRVIDGHRGTKAVKDAVMEAEAEGKIVCKGAEFEKILMMKEALHRDRRSSELINQQGVAESSIFWNDKHTNVLCRARPDWFIPSLGVIADLKTFSDIDSYSLERQIARMKYHVQAAFYLRAIESLTHQQTQSTDFVNIFVTTEEPFLARACPMSPAFLELGERFLDTHLPYYRDCLEKNEWPGPLANEEGFLELNPPDYLLFEAQ